MSDEQKNAVAAPAPAPAAANANNNAAVDLAAELKKFNEWNTATVYSEAGEVLASTVKTDPEEIKGLTTLFNDRDITIGQGLTINGNYFEVQRFYDDLVYGRLLAAREKMGVAVCKTVVAKNKQVLFTIITYNSPVVSARAIPQLRDFSKKVLETL